MRDCIVSFAVKDGTTYSNAAFRNIIIDESIRSCGDDPGGDATSFPAWGIGVIGGAGAAICSSALTCAVTGVTLGTAWMLNKHRTKIKYETENIPLDDV